MSAIRQLPAPDATVTVDATVAKLCPIVDEVDRGHVTIRYRTEGVTFELHELAAYLATFADRHLSHEDFTAEVADALGADVASYWSTAGLGVTVAVLRQPVDANGS